MWVIGVAALTAHGDNSLKADGRLCVPIAVVRKQTPYETIARDYDLCVGEFISRSGSSEGPDLVPLRIYSVGIVLTTDRVSSGGLHSGSGFLGGSVTAARSLGALATGGSTWAPVA